jgi:hypothetical protein
MLEETTLLNHTAHWSNQDERRWKSGKIVCAHGPDAKVEEAPPPHCHYRLEHLLSENHAE